MLTAPCRSLVIVSTYFAPTNDILPRFKNIVNTFFLFFPIIFFYHALDSFSKRSYHDDIKNRNRLHKLLEGYGHAVQKFCFEMYITSSLYKKMLRSIQRETDPQKDRFSSLLPSRTSILQ
ncbi:MAG: CRISPR-associated endonuclease Cas2 [Lachnospiraceae bacterium]|nr:CRISPR-associated endonuclease Cas2 [Lachnospiraceae bacterium]